MPLPLALIGGLMAAGLLAKTASGVIAANKNEAYNKKQLEEQKRQARQAAIERALTGRRTGSPAFSRTMDPIKPPDMTGTAILGGLGDLASGFGAMGLGKGT